MDRQEYFYICFGLHEFDRVPNNCGAFQENALTTRKRKEKKTTTTTAALTKHILTWRIFFFLLGIASGVYCSLAPIRCFMFVWCNYIYAPY